MNCKNCDNKLPNDAKFCNKCGKPIVDTHLSVLNVEKQKKSIKNTGDSVYAIGWLTIAINIGIYIWSILDKNFSESGLPVTDLPGAFLMVVAGSIFVILGNRIKQLTDKNIKLYVQVLLGLSVLLFIWIVASGGRVGLMFFIIVGYLIHSLFSINKLMKAEEFTSTLIDPTYKLNNKGWVIFGVAAIVLFFIASIFDPIIRGVSSSGDIVKTDQNNSAYTSKEEIIKQAVKELKSSTTLPNQVDESTVLVDVTAESSAIRYHYTLSNIDSSKFSDEGFKSYLATSVCKNAEIKNNILDRGINMEYSYIDKDTQKSFFASISKEDCLMK